MSEAYVTLTNAFDSHLMLTIFALFGWSAILLFGILDDDLSVLSNMWESVNFCCEHVVLL